MTLSDDHETEDDDLVHDCDCMDRVKPGEHYICPKCDREWMPEDEEDD